MPYKQYSDSYLLKMNKKDAQEALTSFFKQYPCMFCPDKERCGERLRAYEQDRLPHCQYTDNANEL